MNFVRLLYENVVNNYIDHDKVDSKKEYFNLKLWRYWRRVK